MTDLAARIADVKPVNLDTTERLKSHEFAVEYVKAQAEEIDKLKARIEELEKALEPFANAADSYNQNKHHNNYFIDYEAGVIRAHHLRTAARALKA